MTPNEILRFLPEVVRRTAEAEDPLETLLVVMSAMQTPSEHVLDALDAAFDPMRADDPLVSMLARWVGIPATDGATTSASRSLVAQAAQLARYRGTTWALVRYLELATGVSGYEVAEPSEQPFHLVVMVPAAARAQEDRIRGIVEAEKPAYATYTLEIVQ